MEHNELDHRSSGRPNAEEEIIQARRLMESGDFVHALRHLGDAVVSNPRLPAVSEVLTEFVSRVGSTESALVQLDQVDGQDFVGTVALRAQIYALANRWDEAIPSLFEIVARAPERPWLDAAWFQGEDLAVQVSPDTISESIARLSARVGDPVAENEQASLLPALNLVRAVISHHPRNPSLLWHGSTLARRLAAFDDAIGWAEQSFSLQPTHEAAVAKGFALRSAGRLEEALDSWLLEAKRIPDSPDLYLDIAELLAAVGRPTEGLEWAERVIAQNSQHHKAVAIAHRLRYAADQDVRHLIALAQDAHGQSKDDYSTAVLARETEARPWLGRITLPQESVINVLTKVLEKQPPSPDLPIELTVSAVEPPSALLALYSAFPKAQVSVAAVPKPDARKPLKRVRHTVWKYSKTTAKPAVSPPSSEASEAIRQLASIRWLSPLEAYGRAASLAKFDPKDLLGVLVHPPEPRDDEIGRTMRGQAPELWLRAVQVWACLGIARHQAETPWASSRRRQILDDLLNGPEDWVSEAAGFAIVAAVWDDPSIIKDAQDLVVHRMFAAIQASQQREVTILGSFCHLVLTLPGLHEQVSGLARDILASLSK